MNDEIDTAIHNVLSMIRPNVRYEEAMKFSQAALNLAHVKAVIAGVQAGSNDSPKKRAST